VGSIDFLGEIAQFINRLFRVVFFDCEWVCYAVFGIKYGD
ncbi:unnamed protein product, partial [Acidithrix sp. C25]